MRMSSRTMEPGWRRLAASATTDLWMGRFVAVAHFPTKTPVVEHGSCFDEPQDSGEHQLHSW